MKIRALLEFDDPSALDGDLNAGKRGLSRSGRWLCALERIELSAMAWADQLLDALVIGDGATLVGADSRIGEHATLGAEEDRRDALLRSRKGVRCTHLEL